MNICLKGGPNVFQSYVVYSDGEERKSYICKTFPPSYTSIRDKLEEELGDTFIETKAEVISVPTGEGPYEYFSGKYIAYMRGSPLFFFKSMENLPQEIEGQEMEYVWNF